MLRTLSGPAMGSRWTARLDCDDTQAAVLTTACAAAVEAVEAQMSNWRADSDLTRLNAAPVGNWVAIPAHLMTVLAKAAEIGQASDGLFDIGVGALVQAWGFGPAQGLADPKAISALLGKPLRSFATLTLDPTGLRACKSVPLTLDLSGIAKGYGVDVLAQVLSDHAIRDCLCGLDGELVARGKRPDGQPWAVALEEPDATRRKGRSLIELSDRAIATSGSYRHFVTLERDAEKGLPVFRNSHATTRTPELEDVSIKHHPAPGKLRVSHTMNPRTGGPAISPLVSVSVLHDTCMAADAWATVLMVLGDRAGPEFARAHGLQAIFLAQEKGHITETLTGFAPA